MPLLEFYSTSQHGYVVDDYVDLFGSLWTVEKFALHCYALLWNLHWVVIMDGTGSELRTEALSIYGRDIGVDGKLIWVHFLRTVGEM